ncbi:aromatic ring-hydroxylating oxygenase subunit alpha [Azohydromonas sediminis]|uniref:aromatic ring-hydroxylating dioxygenase subunit alpha n=1 Tax=Azohydromonas sediminis TaxID=2259674 RepID=UPI000E6534E9|nr:aromatic ring-hydroxylating dioxygenase subunit alpha [Azohydromonas sediminis]
MFPKNAWYVACMPHEIDDKPLGRTVCNERMVFFRGPEGQATALEDWCPHRGAPLSLGRVVEGKLVCGYHGLEMGCDGKTVAMPGQRVRGFPPIRHFPVIERYGFVWVWPGDAARADPARLPHLAWAEDPAWTYGGGMYHVRCDYRLMIDNLMDLTHEKYVHATSIGQKELDEVVPQTTTEGDVVITKREMPGVKAPPFWQAAMRGNGHDPEATVDRWQRCRFVPPSNVFIDVGVALAGHGGFDAPAEVKTSGIVVDLITPETETTMWYFWGLARNFRPADKALTASIREAQGKVFQEDLEMLESQQRNLSAQPQRKLLSLNTDLGGVQARRIIERLVAAERDAATPVAA